MIRKWLGRGIVGVGQRRGLFAFGELLVLVYNPKENKVVTVQNLKGYTIFARFVEVTAYIGLSLEELRLLGKGRRCALIQAVEAVEKHLRDSKANSSDTRTGVNEAETTAIREAESADTIAASGGPGLEDVLEQEPEAEGETSAG